MEIKIRKVTVITINKLFSFFYAGMLLIQQAVPGCQTINTFGIQPLP